MKIKDIYIKRILRHTKEGQGFFCSEVLYQINKGLSKAPLKLLERNNRPVYILERQEVAIPTGEYPILKDFTGKYQWATIGGVPNRKNVEIHKGNFLESTDGCLLFGVCYDKNKEYSNEDLIIKYTEDTCNWFVNDFLLNDEENKQTRRVEQDEVIGRITINA